MFDKKKEKDENNPVEKKEEKCRYTPIIKALDLCLLFKRKDQLNTLILPSKLSFMIKNPIARMTAAIILILSVTAILFGAVIGLTELSQEAYAFLGLITGISATFLFQGSRSDAPVTG